MAFSVEEIQPFEIAGVGGRTTNAAEGSGDGIIGPLWDRVRSGGALAPLGVETAEAVFALYSGYESNAGGPYDFTIGVRVNMADAIPSGFVRRTVRAGRYARAVSEAGPAGRVVFEAWRRVWSAGPDELGGERAFQTDFERHPASALSGGEDPVTLFVGVK